jgi:autotransporter-associated beta strand protein
LPSARAIDYTWSGTSNIWNTASSWSPSFTNGGSNTAATTDGIVFSNLGSNSFASPTLTSNRSFASLVFTADAFAYTFGGAFSLTVNGTAGIVNNANATQTFGNTVQNSQASGLVTNTQAGGSLVFNGGYNLTSSGSSANRTVTFGGVGNITLAGAIGNGGTATAGAVTISSTGTTLFSGANTYGGLTTVSSGGTLRLGNASALGTTAAGTSVSSGGVLDLNGQTIGAETLSLTGTGISSSGALVNTSGTAASLGGAVTLSGNTAIGAGNISLGNISESGSRRLTKVGAGTLTLTGTASHTGGTVISQGTLDVTGGNSIGGSFTLDGATGPVLKLSNLNALATSATLTGAGSSANVGTVDLAAAGTYTLGSYLGNSIKFSASSGGATTLNFTNNSVVTSGTNGGRTITNADANLSLVFDGSLDISSSTAGTGVTFAGAGNTTVNGAIFNGIGQTRTVTKNDAGTLNLSAVNTYEGNTTIANGTLALTGAGAISGSPVITNNGIFNVSAVTGGNYTLGAGQTYVGSGTTIGNLTLNGAFTPGTSPGLATFNNNLTLGSTSTTTMEIGGSTTAGTDYDRVSVAGALTYGGTLNIVAFDLGGGAYNFAQTASFNLFGSGSRSGNFTSVSVGGTALADAGNLGVWTASAGGFDYTFSTLDGVLGIAAPIPEPAASAALGGAALLGLAALRRRRA